MTRTQPPTESADRCPHGEDVSGGVVCRITGGWWPTESHHQNERHLSHPSVMEAIKTLTESEAEPSDD